MTLNFLKRKKPFQPSILLYHNQKCKQIASPRFNDPVSAIPNEIQQNIPQQTQPLSQLVSVEPAEERHRERAMAHIEKLLSEISECQQSEDLNLQQKVKIKGLLDKNAISPKQAKSTVNNIQADDSKLPLDIQELQTIAAMAKRLRIKNKHRITK